MWYCKLQIPQFWTPVCRTIRRQTVCVWCEVYCSVECVYSNVVCVNNDLWLILGLQSASCRWSSQRAYLLPLSTLCLSTNTHSPWQRRPFVCQSAQSSLILLRHLVAGTWSQRKLCQLMMHLLLLLSPSRILTGNLIVKMVYKLVILFTNVMLIWVILQLTVIHS